MGRVITLAQSNLHDLFKGELELYLKSQFPNFNLNNLPNKRVIKIKGTKIRENKPDVIEYIINYCKNNESKLMQLRKFLPSYKNNEKLLIRKMKRLGLSNWYLYEDIRK